MNQNLPVTLNLNVSPTVFIKIKKISELSGMGAPEISQELSQVIERSLDDYLIQLTKEMLASCGVDPALLGAATPHTAGVQQIQEYGSSTMKQILEDLKIPHEQEEGEVDETNDWGKTYVPPKKEAQTENPISKTAADIGAQLLDSMQDVSQPVEEVEETVEGYEDGGEESSFSDMDQELPEEARSEFVLPGDEEVTVKDAKGQKASYSDPLMADIQDEIDGDLSDAGDFFDEDDMEGDFSAPAAKPKVKAGGIPSDVGDGELDILPMDLGIQKVSTLNDGDSRAANSGADFFMAALNNKRGDTSQRNTVRRVRKDIE